MIKRWPIAVLIVVFIFLLICLYNSKLFRENHLLTTGTVIKWKGGNGTRGNFGPLFYFQYRVDGKILTSSLRNNDLQSDIGEIMMGRSFPVVYKKYWYGYMEDILITPSDFEAYSYTFPDSLKWILKHMKK